MERRTHMSEYLWLLLVEKNTSDLLKCDNIKKLSVLQRLNRGDDVDFADLYDDDIQYFLHLT